MSEQIVVVGAGGFGREALDVIVAINAAAPAPVWTIVGVVDDAPSPISLERLQALGVAHLGGLEELKDTYASAKVVIGIGSPAVRERIAAKLDSWGCEPATIVHPAAVIGSDTHIGAGGVVCGGVQLSTNVRLGAYVHLNPGAIVGHDVRLEECVSINPGAIISGEVLVQKGTLVGAGAVVLQGLTIGSGALVGASSCVTKDVPADAIVKGVPAQ